MSRYWIIGPVLFSRHSERVGQWAIADRASGDRVVAWCATRHEAVCWCESQRRPTSKRRRSA